MDIFNALLFWVHMAGLSLGGAAAFGLPVVGAQYGGATPEGRASLAKALDMLSKLGSAGMGLLILSGAVMIWTKFGGPAAMLPLFWGKIAVVIVLIVAIVNAKRNAAKAMTGDREAAMRQPMLGKINIGLLLLIILLAALTFS